VTIVFGRRAGACTPFVMAVARYWQVSITTRISQMSLGVMVAIGVYQELSKRFVGMPSLGTREPATE
jgi:hypothetical protein